MTEEGKEKNDITEFLCSAVQCLHLVSRQHLRIRIHFIRIRIRIQHFRLKYRSGSGSNPDPGVLMTKNWKKFKAEKKLIFFFIKTTIYLSLGLHKGRPNHKRNLQFSKENIQHFKTWYFLIFATFVGNFFPPGSGSGFRIPDWIRIPNPAWKELCYEKIIFLEGVWCIVYYGNWEPAKNCVNNLRMYKKCWFNLNDYL